MQIGIWACAAALAAAVSACEREPPENGLASTPEELSEEQVERALGPEAGPEAGEAPANAAGENAINRATGNSGAQAAEELE